MGFEESDKAKEINERLGLFMEDYIYPRERDYNEDHMSQLAKLTIRPLSN